MAAQELQLPAWAVDSKEPAMPSWAVDSTDISSQESPGILSQLGQGIQKGFETRTVPMAIANRLEALAPMSDDQLRLELGVNKSAKEYYGEDFESLSWEEKTNRVAKRRNEERAAKFPELVGTPFEDSITSNVGEFIGSMVDPTIRLPFGVATKGMGLLSTQALKVAGAGAAWAGGSEVISEWGQGEPLDPWKIGTSAVGGALLVPALAKGIDYVGFKIASRMARKSIEAANAQMDILDKYVLYRTSIGEGANDSLLGALKDTNTSPQALFDMERLTTRQILMPESPSEAVKLMSEIPLNTLEEGMRPKNLVNGVLEAMSSRLDEAYPKVGLRLRKMDSLQKSKSHEFLSEIRPLFKIISSLSSKEQDAFSTAWQTQNTLAMKHLLRNNPEAKANWDKLTSLKKQIYTMQKEAGYKLPAYTDDWYPRVVVNYNGLKKEIGRLAIAEGRKPHQDITILEKSIQQQEAKLKRTLNSIERSEVINNFLSTKPHSYSKKPTATQKREIKNPKQFKKFYASPEQATHMYIREAVNDFEKRAFFGKYLKTNKKNTIDTSRSIGALLESDPAIKYDSIRLNELQQILEARFIGGEMSPNKFVTLARNTNTLGYLTNAFSSIQQGTGIGTTMFRQGIIPTIQSVFGKRYTSAVDMGLKDAVLEMETSLTRTSRWVEKQLVLNGFTWMDMADKTIYVNAALRNYRKLATTVAGQKKIIQKYGTAYGEDIIPLIQSLKEDPIKAVQDPNVKLLLWSELADAHPISMTEMPLSYAKNPNNRLYYSLKSYTVKQLNLINQDIVRKMRTEGQRIEGIKNLVRFAAIMSFVGVPVVVIKNMLQGKEPLNNETVPDIALNSLLKIMGSSTYMAGDVAKGQWDKVVLDLAAPPLSILRALGEDAGDLITDFENTRIENLRSMRYAPTGGAWVYYWFGRGLENDLLAREKADKKKETDPEDLEERRMKLRERKREHIRELREQYGR